MRIRLSRSSSGGYRDRLGAHRTDLNIDLRWCAGASASFVTTTKPAKAITGTLGTLKSPTRLRTPTRCSRISGGMSRYGADHENHDPAGGYSERGQAPRP